MTEPQTHPRPRTTKVTSLIGRRRWWHHEPNPKCWAWCCRTHAVDELAETGSLICLMEVERTDSFWVEIVAVQIVDEDRRDHLVVHDPHVSVRDADTMSPTAAADLELAIRRGCRILEDLGWRA